MDNDIDLDCHAIQRLQPVLRQGKWHVTVALRDGHQTRAIWPGLRDQITGTATDVGSTTMSAHLCGYGYRQGVGLNGGDESAN